MIIKKVFRLFSLNKSIKLLNTNIYTRTLHNKIILNEKNFKAKKGVYLIDENDEIPQEMVKNYNKYTERTCSCGELRIENVGERVILCGWVEYQRMKKFVVLRDGYGHTQIIIKDTAADLQDLFESLPYESIVKVEGIVIKRPQDMINKNQETGEIEVLIDKAIILNKSKDNLPFNIREFQKAKESLRMQYRYLDLRFHEMQRNLRVRSEILMKMREFLINKVGFVEIETPTLFKATPGGAQEFVVPTRFPGQFYSLVQSPQQFKQMLMAGAVDRYFQVARCYRDEGSRPDRQPEFTQLDLEMSFTDSEGVMSVIEDLFQHCWPNFLSTLPRAFRRITYKDAMERFGTDKPDIRFGYELKNCTEVLNANIKYRSPNMHSFCLVFPGQLNIFTKSQKEKFADLAKGYRDVKFVQNKVANKDEWIEKMSNLLSTEVATTFYNRYFLDDESVVFLVYGPKKAAVSLLGKIRLDYVNALEEKGHKIRKQGMHMLWVYDFPLFEEGETENSLNCVHHPFTAPHPEDIDLLQTNPLEVRSLAYDLVLNGNEIGGGSIRIHNSQLQQDIFTMLNINPDSLKHIIEMLGSGCPPHGGIALGLDRFLATILNVTSIRDVIAFPKTFEGRDPLSGAPSSISDEDKRIYHIKSIDN
ncbi:aspartate--tRNA ligase, mitochondrial [Onthophagus taurus]|uniref:aspartate--tRNA ligase, mitochondrial n=1 Tax=Onthophagus taurus TaxID=166361 RepID=UPI0039BE2474